MLNRKTYDYLFGVLQLYECISCLWLENGDVTKYHLIHFETYLHLLCFVIIFFFFHTIQCQFSYMKHQVCDGVKFKNWATTELCFSLAYTKSIKYFLLSYSIHFKCDILYIEFMVFLHIVFNSKQNEIFYSIMLPQIWLFNSKLENIIFSLFILFVFCSFFAVKLFFFAAIRFICWVLRFNSRIQQQQNTYFSEQVLIWPILFAWINVRQTKMIIGHFDKIIFCSKSISLHSSFE